MISTDLQEGGSGSTLTVRRLLASSRHFYARERLDLLVHALAQLPDDVMLDIVGTGPAAEPLRLLTAAYGIGDRVRFPGLTPAAASGPTVYPSALNLSTAPIRPLTGQPSFVIDAAKAIDGPGVAHTMGEFLHSILRVDDPPASLRFDDDILYGHSIVVVTNVPAPYRVELFAEVARRLETAGASFDVVYLATSAATRPWLGQRTVPPFRHHFLRSFQLPRGERHPIVPLDLEQKLRRLKPTVVISAGFSPFVSARVARSAAQARVPFGIYSGETRRMPTAHSRWRRFLRRWLTRRAMFGIAYGYESGEYLLSLEPSLPIVYARNTSRVPPPARTNAGACVRLLTIADLNSARKGVDVLIDALRLMPELQCELTVVGGGRQLGSLESQARGDPRIRFLGFLPREETITQYHDADVFVFPTRQDVYGLVMVEAMGAGLATVVSSAAGALGDLAVDGTNCLVVEGYAPEAWAEALRRVVLDEELRRSLGDHAKQTIAQRWTLEHSADALIAGFRLGALLAATARR